jgi:FtsZ-binding cell division protein ZapB
MRNVQTMHRLELESEIERLRVRNVQLQNENAQLKHELDALVNPGTIMSAELKPKSGEA